MNNKEAISSSTMSDRNSVSQARPKVDMKHGFVRSIIQNQIERDEYHKMVVSMQDIEVSPKSSVTQNRGNENGSAAPAVQSDVKRETSSKRIARQLYVPPHARGEAQSISNKESPATNEKHSPECPTVSIVNELASENSAMRQRAREKLLREKKASGLSGDETVQAEAPAANPPKTGEPLFRLQVTTGQGDTEEIVVCEGDPPARVTKKLVQKLQLSDKHSKEIRTQVEQEMLLRLAEKK